MANSQTGSVSLLVATLAGGLAFLLVSSGLIWIASLIGLILLLVILAYDGDEKRSFLQSLAFSAVCGLCLTLVSLAVYEFLLKGVAPEYPQLARTWLPVTCVGATVVMLLVDVSRMSSRQRAIPVSGAFYFPATVAPVQERPAAPITVAPVQPRPAAAPVQSEPQQPVSVPAFTPEPSRPAASHPESVEPHLVRNNQPAVSVPEAVPLKPGKEASIYVNLMGEGLNMLRAVRAEHLGRDFYRIIEPMPESEQWEYGPGQVVRCRKKNLSSGKAMVAFEEAPRAQ